MRLLLLLSLLAVTDARWDALDTQDGMALFSRQSGASGVLEMKATGLVDAPPEAVWTILKDLDHYSTFMPYTSESRVVKRDGDKVVYFYSRIEPPLVSARDYFIKLVDESQWTEGKGFLKVSWTVATEGATPPSTDLVHIRENEGAWLLEPREAGRKTFLTYTIHLAPGGYVPDVMANRASGISVPRVFSAIKQRAEHAATAAPAAGAK